ncbi:hypothetical protein SAY86_007428 [Trapa natans]|uniref:ARM repeat N-terminal plant domain-containing protein n=1 Tax=Trapa natans TaxID=22666 RepID=A0AAN7LEJ3_TRANT|nr:hypothetical protein SAY86_007428 [Trapa natans]
MALSRSDTMNVEEEFAEQAVHAGVVPPLIELLRGRRVAVRALGHLAAYPHDVFFYSRLIYHCDLLTRGMGGVEMESRKAEEWASESVSYSAAGPSI